MSTAPSVTPSPLLELSLGRFLAGIGRRSRLLLGLAGTAAVATAAVQLALPRQYTVRAAITPVGPRTPSGGLSGLAAAAGLSLGAGSALAPEYYTEIAGSDDLLRRVLEAPATPGDSSTGAPLLAARVLEEQGGDPARLVRRAIPAARRMLSTRISQKSGIVTLGITSRDAALSMRLIEELIAQLDGVNRTARAARNSAEFAFLESRLGETRAALDRAERELERFLAANRSYTSPAVALDQQRVQRNAELARATYVSVANAYAEARMEVFRDTPTLSVVGVPRPPLGPDPRGLVARAVFAAVASLALAIGLMVLHEWACALWPTRIPFASHAVGAVRRA